MAPRIIRVQTLMRAALSDAFKRQKYDIEHPACLGLALFLATEPTEAAHLTIAVNGHGSALNEFCFIAAQEEDHSSNVFRLGPLGEVGAWHRFPISLSVDNAGKN